MVKSGKVTEFTKIGELYYQDGENISTLPDGVTEDKLGKYIELIINVQEGNTVDKNEITSKFDGVIGENILKVNTLDTLLMFTNFGNYLYVPVHIIPDLKLGTVRKTLFFIAPELLIPEALQKEITIYDFPLPTLDEIRAKFDSMLSQNESVKTELSEEEKDKLCKSLIEKVNN